MDERIFNFKYETRDEAKMIPCNDVHFSADGSLSVSIEKGTFEKIFGNPNEANNAYNRSVIHG